MSTDYIFDTKSDLGRQHMDALENLFDGTTTECLEATGIQPGWRCLDLGAGGGSITRWLADRVGPAGTVVSVDLATDYLTEGPGIEVHQHDINDGLPVEGPYNLIHTRLLLMHLPRRREILKMLIDALAPGGWLVIDELNDQAPQVLTAPSEADTALFNHMQYLSMEVVSPASGLSWQWASEVDDAMTDAGLTEIGGAMYSPMVVGGSHGCLIHDSTNRQAEPLLLKAGATHDQLSRYRELLADPTFRMWFNRFICLCGQKPAV